MNAKRIGWGLAMGFFAVVLLGTVGCGEGGVDTVEAGTYEGTIDKVVLDEKEIYVTLDNGKRLELYFTDETELVTGGIPGDFTKLSKGAKVRVAVKREGNRNVPTKVEIIE